MQSKKYWCITMAILGLSITLLNGCSNQQTEQSSSLSSSLNSVTSSSSNLSSDSSVNSTTQSSSSSQTPTSKYTVTFDANGGQFDNKESTWQIQVDEHTSIGAANVIKPSKKNYGFQQWTKTQNGNDGWNLDVDLVDENMTLYASWIANQYHVTIINDNPNAGSVSGDGDYSYGTNITVTATENPGYTFVGWYLNVEDDAVSHDLTYNFALLQETTLTAKWEAKEYQITLNAGLGANPLQNTQQSVRYNENYTLEVPTKNGYAFEGWYYNDVQLTNNQGVSLNPYTYTTGIEVEAHYIANTYHISVTFNFPTYQAILDHITVIGEGNYKYGEKVTLKIESDLPIIEVAGWHLDRFVSQPEVEITVTESKTIKVSLNTKGIPLHYMLDGKEYDTGYSENYYLSNHATNETLQKFDDFRLLINQKFDGWYEDDQYTMKCNATPETHHLPVVKKEDGTYHAYVYGRIVKNVIEKTFLYTENEDQTITITDYIGEETNISIPKTYDGKTVSAIGKRAFDNKMKNGDDYYWYNTNIQSVFIPNTVKTIGEDAFRNCKNLQTVTFEENSTLSEIGAHAFVTCDSLEKITLPNSLRTVREGAFSYLVGLHYMYVPKTITTIEKDAFVGYMVYTNASSSNLSANWSSNAFSLDYVYYDVAREDLIYEIDGIQYLYHESQNYFEVVSFKTKAEHFTVLEKIQLKDQSKEVNVTHIRTHAFNNARTMKTIIIPASIVDIGSWAFHDTQNVLVFTYLNDHSKDSTWFNFTKSVYLNGEWDLVDGVPTAKNG